MDVNMPEVDGIEALRRIMEEEPSVVVMVTAWGDPATVRRALNAGASGYLVKPFRDEQLAPAISVAQARFQELYRARLSNKATDMAATRRVREALRHASELRGVVQREQAAAQALAATFHCSPPKIPGFEIDTLYAPAASPLLIGGDYFDFIQFSPIRLGLVVGDVCGKGLPAATLTTVARHTLRAYALEDPTPEAVLVRLNRALCSQTTEECAFVTLVYGVLDLSTFDFRYANAGHPSPLLCSPDQGECCSLEATGGLLGVDPRWTWTSAQVQIAPGSVLTLFTDGITEARRGNEQFGPTRVQATVCELCRVNAIDLAHGLKEQARAFGGGELNDDVAIVVVRHLP
jgi:sigma-B regulation protein RsbU (phosphoserine phosphatase)